MATAAQKRAQARRGGSSGEWAGGFLPFQAFRLPGLELPVAWSLLISILAGMLTRPKSRQSEFVSS